MIAGICAGLTVILLFTILGILIVMPLVCIWKTTEIIKDKRQGKLKQEKKRGETAPRNKNKDHPGVYL